MKKIFFFLFLPFLALSQEVVTDTVYIQKQGNIYYIVTMTTFSDSTVTGNKQILGDSLTAINALVTDAERQSNTIAIHAKPLILKSKTVKRINYYNNLHQQISGRAVYVSTAIRDTTAFLGTWNLNFNGEIILGEIQLNNNNRLIFNPDNGKVYTISTKSSIHRKSASSCFRAWWLCSRPNRLILLTATMTSAHSSSLS